MVNITRGHFNTYNPVLSGSFFKHISLFGWQTKAGFYYCWLLFCWEMLWNHRRTAPAASLFSECSYARACVGVLLEAAEYCFGSILPAQHQIQGGLPGLHRRRRNLTSGWGFLSLHLCWGGILSAYMGSLWVIYMLYLNYPVPAFHVTFIGFSI